LAAAVVAVVPFGKWLSQDGHILLCTNEYELQTDPLNAHDLAAVSRTIAMLGAPHLAFYNFGRHSGRSQPHKHVQILPLPLTGELATVSNSSTPIDAVIKAAAAAATVAIVDSDGSISGCEGGGGSAAFRCPELSFRHAVMLMPPAPSAVDATTDPGFALNLARGAQLLAICKQLVEFVGLEYRSAAGCDLSYNWLCTNNWMMVVGRSSDRCEGVEVNSLGFAGSVLVRDEAALDRIKAIGPMAVLNGVAIPVASKV
jgi:ATP adenylyltransferase